MEPVRIFVGSDRSQALAVKVLEHSIKRHTKLFIEVIPMEDLPIRMPKDPRLGQRTGFSFSRFCIPKMMGYKGKAIYMDADMLVFKDIAELWEIPFDNAKIVIQEELTEKQRRKQKVGAPKKRLKQCSVMLLDCSRLDWDIEKIIEGLDQAQYTYEELMYNMCILDESEIKYAVPFRWNSLEFYNSETCLIHYTDMFTQPWASSYNKYDEPWYNEIRLMLADGTLTWDEINGEIALGYFRPSLVFDIKYGHQFPSVTRPIKKIVTSLSDRIRGFKMHKAVYAAKKRREQAIREFERKAAVTAE